METICKRREHMNLDIKKIDVFGDSILKGVQLNSQNKKYVIDNNIDVDAISRKHGLKIVNFSRFGCTIEKGKKLMERNLEKGLDCDAVLMEYGGNDCDFIWKEIGENPEKEHVPHTPLNRFIEIYHEMIDTLKTKGIRPILTNLPPIDPQRFFDWFCGPYNKENILGWLGSINTIYRHQEMYSRAVEKIARDTNSLLVDLRESFLSKRRIESLFCDDGIHPNTYGQKVITEAFMKFAETAVV